MFMGGFHQFPGYPHEMAGNEQLSPRGGPQTLHYMLGHGIDNNYPHAHVATSVLDGGVSSKENSKKPAHFSQPHFSVSQLAHHGMGGGMNMPMTVPMQAMGARQFYNPQGFGMGMPQGLVPPLARAAAPFHSHATGAAHHGNQAPIAPSLSSQIPRQTSFGVHSSTDDEASVASARPTIQRGVRGPTISPRDIPCKQKVVVVPAMRHSVHQIDYPAPEDNGHTNSTAAAAQRRPRSESFSQNQCSLKLDDPITAAEHLIVNFCMQRNPWTIVSTIQSDIRALIESTPYLADELAEYHEALSPNELKMKSLARRSSSCGGGLRPVRSSMSLSDETDASSFGDDVSSIHSETESVYEDIEPSQRILRLRNADLMRTFMSFASKTLQSVSSSLCEQEKRRAAARRGDDEKVIDSSSDVTGEFVKALSVCTETWWAFASTKYL
jgi:hypothetical protein